VCSLHAAVVRLNGDAMFCGQALSPSAAAAPDCYLTCKLSAAVLAADDDMRGCRYPAALMPLLISTHAS
jgi:hypothetical protein